ncbi:MAG: YebC/PmpR family DNA-binding transcriptional regulator [Bacteroidetes bacterium]|nr:MAG: YebC/PmpR family DNA-binding transcriptional regulator [Bacteroidota bacterium]
MSGHNKWSTIKRKKGAADAKRSKAFSRILKEIAIAVKEGGSDIDGNPRLRVAVNNAKGVNMPKDNIDRAINRAEKEPENLQETTFEGYGPGGIALFVECLSDNNNRTVSNVRAVFTRRGGSLGTNGSLSFLFSQKGVFTLSAEDLQAKGLSDEDLELELIDAGAEDIERVEEEIIVTTGFEDFGAMQKKLDEMELTPKNAELQRIPNDTKELPLEEAQKVMRIVAEFEDLDDVQNVYHNLEMTDELAEALESEA